LDFLKKCRPKGRGILGIDRKGESKNVKRRDNWWRIRKRGKERRKRKKGGFLKVGKSTSSDLIKGKYGINK